MEKQRIPAIYEDGVLKPLEPLDLAQHQAVYLFVEVDTEAPRLLELTEIKRMLRRAMPDFTERYHIKSLALFGSYVRGEQRPDSDLDLLVEFNEIPTLLDVVGLEQELSELLGVKVDLVLKDSLKPAIGRAILAEVVSI